MRAAMCATALVALAAVFAIASASARAGVAPPPSTAGAFVAHCSQDAHRNVCTAQIMEVDISAFALRECTHLSSTNEKDVVPAVVDWLARHGETNKLPAADGILFALSKMWPCRTVEEIRGWVPKIPPPRFGWPVCGTVGRGIEYTLRPELNRVSLHSGLDLGNRAGIPVRAGASGRVSAVETREGYGLTIEIAHEKNYRTLYGHLQSASVGAGESVGRGQVIGMTGSSGGVPSPKLHFEVRRGKVLLDPAKYLEPDKTCQGPPAGKTAPRNP